VNGKKSLEWLESYDLSTAEGIDGFIKEAIKHIWMGDLGTRQAGALNGALHILLTEGKALVDLERRIQQLEQERDQSKINALHNRVTHITGKNSRGTLDDDYGLSHQDANIVRAVWINLNADSMELQEYEHLRKRQQDLCEKGGGRTRQEDLEEMANSARRTFLMHDVIMGRVLRTHALRDLVTSELAPRALRYRELLDKTELSTVEAAELEILQAWLHALQGRVMLEAG
jgi:hypothetical protein